MYPELLVSILLCEVMLASEAIFISGAKRYSNYSGYGTDTKFLGRYEGQNNYEHFVALDAISF